MKPTKMLKYFEKIYVGELCAKDTVLVIWV